jgi:hypothetical protein
MVDRAETKIYKSDGRHFLYLPKNLITDSQFPLRPGEKLTVTFTKSVLVIQREEDEDSVCVRVPREVYWKFSRILDEAGSAFEDPEDYIVHHLREEIEKYEEWKRQARELREESL